MVVWFAYDGDGARCWQSLRKLTNIVNLSVRPPKHLIHARFPPTKPLLRLTRSLDDLDNTGLQRLDGGNVIR